jgi:hypothetical protein
MSAPDYHGIKPVTDDDKKMAKKHLDLTHDLIEQKKDLLEDKIDDHKKALINRVKEGNTKSASYNRGHIKNHEKDLDDANDDEDEIRRSLNTLGSLKTHSRRTYNDVRKGTVKLMYRKTNSNVSSK